MKLTLDRTAELTAYLRLFPKSEWTQCLQLTIALGVRCAWEKFPKGPSLQLLQDCLDTVISVTDSVVQHKRMVSETQNQKKHRESALRLRIPGRELHTAAKPVQAKPPSFRKQPALPHASVLSRGKSVDSSLVTEPRTNLLYAEKLSARMGYQAEEGSVLWITTKFLQDPLVVALSTHTSPHPTERVLRDSS